MNITSSSIRSRPSTSRCRDDVIEAIAEHGILMEYENPNQEKYPGQRIIVVRIDDYPYCVPFSFDGDVVDLKTVYPN